jgi:calpain-15
MIYSLIKMCRKRDEEEESVEMVRKVLQGEAGKGSEFKGDLSLSMEGGGDRKHAQVMIKERGVGIGMPSADIEFEFLRKEEEEISECVSKFLSNKKAKGGRAVPFVDEDFAANVSSIDGINSDSKVSTEPNCRCTPVRKAKLLKVNKDGVNQGKLFWGCSKKQGEQCGYFKWMTENFHRERDSQIEWKRLTSKDGFQFVRKEGFDSGDILQGGVGDCWFLSGLSVVASVPRLISNIVLGNTICSEDGYTVCFFIDGKRCVIEVDDYFPMKYGKKDSSEEGLSLAYSKSKDNQLWVPLVEKAYAKAHKCYHAISGGWIAEALHDLTGHPTETIWFDDLHFDSETFWATLLSFIENNFCVGASCFKGGKGLVGR